ncbi:hypothetical protein WH47_05697 [Habropoda laboriosa]|uniref:Uncharacterized protein n=1 Tax=Habropoda laboriosa TaxID=597456 RepID=A0A0L7QQT3_9HYME|nr:hypothetical protein WH47_05697 [Habropoda laboriosa]
MRISDSTAKGSKKPPRVHVGAAKMDETLVKSVANGQNSNQVRYDACTFVCTLKLPSPLRVENGQVPLEVGWKSCESLDDSIDGISRDALDEIFRDALNEISRDTSDEISRDALDEKSHKAWDEISRDTVSFMRRFGRGIRDTSDEISRGALDEISRDTSDEISRDALDEKSHKAWDEISRDTVKFYLQKLQLSPFHSPTAQLADVSSSPRKVFRGGTSEAQRRAGRKKLEGEKRGGRRGKIGALNETEETKPADTGETEDGLFEFRRGGVQAGGKEEEEDGGGGRKCRACRVEDERGEMGDCDCGPEEEGKRAH